MNQQFVFLLGFGTNIGTNLVDMPFRLVIGTAYHNVSIWDLSTQNMKIWALCMLD